MKNFFYFLCSFLFLTACNPKGEDAQTAFAGRWQIEDIESTDSSMNVLVVVLFAMEYEPAYFEIAKGEIKLLDKDGKVLDDAKLIMTENGEMEIYKNGDIQDRCLMKYEAKGKARLQCGETTFLLARQ